MENKLSIIVPYRDREEHLKKFVPHMESSRFLEGIDFDIIIVEQTTKPFNRGKLLNIGAVESPDSTYYCFHDVDMLPINSDYSLVSNPTHLAAEAEQFGYQLPYGGYFGGVTLFDKGSFYKANGYSNEYWGWGAEDDDVMLRCLIRGIRCSRKPGRYQSLSHERKITQDLYNENLRKFFSFRDINDPEEKERRIKEDGISTLVYKIVEEEKITQKTRRIKVKI